MKSIEIDKTWAENGNKKKGEVQFSAEADSSECTAKGDFKQEKIQWKGWIIHTKSCHSIPKV